MLSLLFHCGSRRVGRWSGTSVKYVALLGFRVNRESCSYLMHNGEI